MSTDTLWLSYRLAQPDAGAWVLASTVAILSFVLAGLCWGFLWNKKWGLHHVGWVIFALLCALLLGGAAFAWRGCGETVAVINLSRETLADRLNNSGSFNLDVFKRAFDELQALGSEEGMDPPNLNGRLLQLRSENDARVLATTAAAAARRSIARELIFVSGAPLPLLDAQQAGAAAVEMTPPPSKYPTRVGAENEYAKNAVRIQVSKALDSVQHELRRPSEDLRFYLAWFMVAMVLVLMVITALLAYRDIEEHPRPTLR